MRSPFEHRRLASVIRMRDLEPSAGPMALADSIRTRIVAFDIHISMENIPRRQGFLAGVRARSLP